MVNELHDTHHKRPNMAIESSKLPPLTHLIDNPLNDFSNSDDQTNHPPEPTGIFSPPFYTKRPNRLIKWHDLNFFKNETILHHITNLITSLTFEM